MSHRDHEPIQVDVDSRVDQGFSTDDMDVTEEEAEQLRKEREERLDPENRPTNAIVDNTNRDFDATTGEFGVPADQVENGPVIGADRPKGVEVDD
ncbi:hypothetical protein [Aeromicrobium terrae]|uniref:Uncharacterized protein n=1 Tax=Aeromicrobium terrae TaxID=2498846 RepID=A0A5C8NLY9_9ACTN|nr:hypothetical protein [Aeromicrobium terrae]TXL62258.1 hypothetical protein FHP06_06060 [Aeromicrobium terrae]